MRCDHATSGWRVGAVRRRKLVAWRICRQRHADTSIAFRSSRTQGSRTSAWERGEIKSLDFETDVVVVGAGPCGLAAAIAIERAGWRALIIEASCVVSSIAGYPTYLTFFSTAERIEIGGMPFVVATEKPTRRDALAYYREVVERQGLIVRQYERVEHIDTEGERFIVHSRPRGRAARTTAARAVVLATGCCASPNVLG